MFHSFDSQVYILTIVRICETSCLLSMGFYKGDNDDDIYCYYHFPVQLKMMELAKPK